MGPGLLVRAGPLVRSWLALGLPLALGLALLMGLVRLIGLAAIGLGLLISLALLIGLARLMGPGPVIPFGHHPAAVPGQGGIVRAGDPGLLGHQPWPGRGRQLPAPEPLPAEEDQAVYGQEHRGQYRLGERVLHRVLQQRPNDADGDRRENDHPGELLVHGLDPPVRDRGAESDDDPQPVPPEVNNHRDRGGHVQADDERQIGRAGARHAEVLRPAAAHQRRDQHAVPQAGHREQLGHPLEQADDHCLGICQVGDHGSLSLPLDAGSARTSQK